MNTFDAVVYLCLLVAVIMGFKSGLLRSLATILGYVAAAPVAVAAGPYLSAVLTEQFKIPADQTWLGYAGVFLVAGIVLSALLRTAVNELVGPDASIADRLAGAMLGAVRIGLLAVLMVLIFDRIIPSDRQPAFLAESRLRPVLSSAAQMGLKSLPPDVAEYIDRLKRERGI